MSKMCPNCGTLGDKYNGTSCTRCGFQGTLDCHDTHCCIDHGCKYGDEDCPVANGVRKQQYLCEICWHDRDFHWDGIGPKITEEQQQEYIDALWEQKHNPKSLTKFEAAVAEIAKTCGGRHRLINILQAVRELPFNEHKEGKDDTIRIEIVLDVLNDLKGIK